MNSSFSEFEKKSDEITATGGHRILSPVDVNDVLSLCSMFAAKDHCILLLIIYNYYLC